MTANPYAMTGPAAEVLLAQFGTGVYVATMAVQLQFSPHVDTRWGGGIYYTAPSATRIAASLSCPCAAVLEVELHDSEAAEIARYCLRTGHCTFIRLPTLQPPCEHWQPLPIDHGDRLRTAETRLELARQALIRTGYFTADQVGDDVAPRITEIASRFGEHEPITGKKGQA